MKYPVILFSCFLCFSSVETKSLGIESVIRFGDSLFRHADYNQALLEYQRAFFFSADTLKPRLCEKIAACYFAMEHYLMARNYYDSAIFYSSPDHALVDYEFQKLHCFMMEGKFGVALLELNALEICNDINKERRRNLYRGICCFGMGRYDEMQKHFLQSIPQNDSLKIQQLQELYEQHKILMRPYPGLAMILSIVLPGAGQVYTGDLKAGLNSLFLLAGLVYLGTSVSFISPVLTIPFIPRYYLGGILHAGVVAREKRKENQYDFFLRFSRILSGTSSFRALFEPVHRDKANPVNLMTSVSEGKIILNIMYLGYKEFISSQDVDACVFEPSCSDYTIEAIDKKGVVIGLLEGLDRLSRCHPFVGMDMYPYDARTMKYHDPM